jgi:protein N-terminal amidase
VAVGYPEKDVSGPEPRAYNSLVFVNKAGEITAHTRKSFLYYTDETWASEGQGFFSGKLQSGSSLEGKNLAAGICMDINPYKFKSPWTSYEFANHALASQADLVVLSTAWLTRMSTDELQGNAKLPDLDTVGYWLERMRPLMGPNGSDQEIIVVFANRCGEEGEAPLIGPVKYAGSSTVMGISRGDGRMDGEVRIWDMLGRAEEGVLVVDTKQRAQYRLKRSLPAEDLNEDNTPASSDQD